jgi:hypothetical protein
MWSSLGNDAVPVDNTQIKSRKFVPGLVNHLSMKGSTGKESTPLSVGKVCHVCYIETELKQ